MGGSWTGADCAGLEARVRDDWLPTAVSLSSLTTRSGTQTRSDSRPWGRPGGRRSPEPDHRADVPAGPIRACRWGSDRAAVLSLLPAAWPTPTRLPPSTIEPRRRCPSCGPTSVESWDPGSGVIRPSGGPRSSVSSASASPETALADRMPVTQNPPALCVEEVAPRSCPLPRTAHRVPAASADEARAVRTARLSCKPTRRRGPAPE